MIGLEHFITMQEIQTIFVLIFGLVILSVTLLVCCVSVLLVLIYVLEGEAKN